MTHSPLSGESTARIVRLARQYRRLLGHYHNQRHEVLLQDVADTLACTPRYARTLLKEMKQREWISWASLPGRGKLSTLQCRLDENALREIATHRLQPDIAPTFHDLPGAQAIPDGDHFSLSCDRPVPAVVPSYAALHVSRHLLRMVHAGLMKYRYGNTHPVCNLAHHYSVSDDRLTWRFFLRRGLIWHNGESVQPQQLLQRMQARMGTPELPYVISITLKEHCMLFQLSQPDDMLLHRLAHPACSLAHPVHPTVGLGPFRVTEHHDACVRLERFAFWHGEMPQASTVTLETVLRIPADWGVTRLDTPRSALSSETDNAVSRADIFSFLSFNQCKPYALTAAQRARLTAIAQSVARRMAMKHTDLRPLPAWLTTPLNAGPVALPPALSMVCFSTPDTDRFASALARHLRRLGCRLTLTPIHQAHWMTPGKDWPDMDIALGYLVSHQDAIFTVEERWRHSKMVQAFWPVEMQHRIHALLDRSVQRGVARHCRFLVALLRHGIRHNLINPLYQKNFTLTFPASVQGIRCHPQCLPDFTTLWIDNDAGACRSAATD